MKDHKMVPANLKPEVMIKEKDQHCYHVQMTIVRINPADPTHPEIKTEVRPFRIQDYKLLFGGTTEEQIRKKKVMGIDSAEVVHDPGLEFKSPEPIKGPVRFEPVKTDTEKIDEGREAETKARTARRVKDSMKLKTPKA